MELKNNNQSPKILSRIGILALFSLSLFIFWYSSFYINIFYGFSQNEGVGVFSIISFSFFSFIWLIVKIKDASVKQPVVIKTSENIWKNKFKILSLSLIFANLIIGLYIYNFRNYNFNEFLLLIPFFTISLLSICLNINKKEDIEEKLKIVKIFEKILTVTLLLSTLFFLLTVINPAEGIINASAILGFLVIGPAIIIDFFILLILISFNFYNKNGLIASILFFILSLIISVCFYVLVMGNYLPMIDYH